MKRSIAILLTVIFILSLSSCSEINNMDTFKKDISENNSSVPDDGDSNTVLNAAADSKNSQTLYLWEEENIPATTEYTHNYGNYSDDPDFRPYLVSFPVPEGMKVKGAVLICAGGAFQFRSDENEGTPVAEELASRGYQSFVVSYPLPP